MASAILILSLGLQFGAAALALLQVRRTGRTLAWLLIAGALVLMGIRRAVTLIQAGLAGAAAVDLAAESVALLTSALMLAGVWRIGAVFGRLDRLQRATEKELEKRRQAEAAARESEAQLRLITDNMLDAVSRIDAGGAMLFCSPSVERIFGIPPAELIGRRADERVHPQDRERLRRQVREAAAQRGTALQVEYRYLQGGGAHVWVESAVRLLYGADGGYAGAILGSRDVTARKRAEESLQREQEFIGALLENMLDAVVACDAEGRLVLFNRAAREWHGLDPLAIPQAEWAARYDLYAEDNVTPLPAEAVPLARAFRGERVRDAPLVIRAAGQAPRFVTCHCVRFLDREGRPLGAMAVMRDLTEARRVELALKESEERFRQVVEAAPLPIGIAHAAGPIEYLNPRFRQTFGYSLEEVPDLERWFAAAYPDPDYRAAIRASWGQAMEEATRVGGASQALDTRVVCRDGTVRIMQVLGALVGERVIAVFNDLTERARHAEALQASIAEKESLLQEVHHRVKNNLQVISSLLHLQFRQVANEEVRDFLRDTQNRIRAMAMVHEILYQSGNVAAIDFARYVESLCRHVGRSYGAAARNIRLHPRIAAAPLSLDQAVLAGLIVSELTTNAIKHAFAGRAEGEIRVELAEDGPDRLVLRVADDGAGLPAEAAPEGGGTLGLLLVRNLSRQLDGRLAFRNAPGAVFEIVFPRQAPER